MDWMVMISLRMVCISYSTCSSVVNGGLRDLLLPGDGVSYDMEEDNGIDGLDGDDLAEDGTCMY